MKRGDLILKIYDPNQVTAQIMISEKEIEGVRVGQPVVLRARSYPDREFRGRVAWIATSAQGTSGNSAQSSLASTASVLTSGNKAILVSTEVDNDRTQLKAEMTGHAKISCGSRRVLDIISRRLARTFKVELWSWW